MSSSDQSTATSGQPTATSKPVADRISESVYLLKQLDEIGITSDAAAELRSKMNEWIRTGLPWAGKIKFPTYGRAADVVLPMKADRTATIRLRAI